MQLKHFVLCATALLFPILGFAGKPDHYRAFVDSCIQAFDQSSGNGSLGVGRQICECTATESRHEGVSRAALEQEAARIKKDPKHQIRDRKLLNALQYCSIQNLKD